MSTFTFVVLRVKTVVTVKKRKTPLKNAIFIKKITLLGILLL